MSAPVLYYPSLRAFIRRANQLRMIHVDLTGTGLSVVSCHFAAEDVYEMPAPPEPLAFIYE